MLRILIYGINYAPELIGIGKYTGEMAESLSARGYEIRVITAPPYYPDWQIAPGFSAWRYQRRELHGVKVWRCPLWVPRQPSGLKRILHLLFFAISSLPIILWEALFWRPDVVLVVEPPFFCTVGALLAARLSGAKSWLHIQDFEIDAGFELGLLPSSPSIRASTVVLEHWLMNRFDRVSTISNSMLERLQNKGVRASRCVYFPNWVDTEKIYPLPSSISLREELGIQPNTIVALYSGNMGTKQGLEILITAAELLAAKKQDILFVLCGEGSEKKRLIKLAKGMSNVRFLDLQPVERLNALLNLANIHLLPQLSSAADLVMPSKLQGICASGRPVIGTVCEGTQVAEVIKTCGIVVPPGDVKALANAILHLATHPQQCAQLGYAARELAVSRWDRQKILGQIEQKLVELHSSSNTASASVDSEITSFHLSSDIPKELLHETKLRETKLISSSVKAASTPREILNEIDLLSQKSHK